MIPLGPVFADQVLGGGSAAFGLLMTALWLRRGHRRRLSACRATAAVPGRRCSSSRSWPPASRSSRRRRHRAPRLAVLLTGVVGACAGTAYVDRLHRPPGERQRRAARSHVRRALHRDPVVPADLADRSPRCGPTCGTAVPSALVHRPGHRDRRRDVRASRRSVRVRGVAGSSRSSPASCRGAPVQRTRKREAPARRLGRSARAGLVDGGLHRPRGRRRQRQEHAGPAARRSAAGRRGRDVVETFEPGADALRGAAHPRAPAGRRTRRIDPDRPRRSSWPPTGPQHVADVIRARARTRRVAS